MELQDILTTLGAVVTLLLGDTGIKYFLMLRQEKRKAKLENDQTQANVSGTIEDDKTKSTDRLSHVFDQIQEQNDKYMEQLKQYMDLVSSKDAIIEEKNNKIIELANDLAASNSFLCKNDLCPFRDPAKGLGIVAFTKMKENGEMQGNQKDILEIIKGKGWELKKLDDT